MVNLLKRFSRIPTSSTSVKTILTFQKILRNIHLSFVRYVEGGRVVFEAADFSAGRSSVGVLNEDSPHQEKEMYTAGGLRCSGATPSSIVICRGKKYVSE